MMRFKLESLLSGLTSLAAVAYALGWLKSFYFYQAFGVSLVSTAKHFGSFDALQYLAEPDKYFSSVTTRADAALSGWDESRSFYFLRKTDANYLLLDLKRLRDQHHIGVVVVPIGHVRWIEGSVTPRIQLGNRWF